MSEFQEKEKLKINMKPCVACGEIFENRSDYKNMIKNNYVLDSVYIGFHKNSKNFKFNPEECPYCRKELLKRAKSVKKLSYNGDRKFCTDDPKEIRDIIFSKTNYEDLTFYSIESLLNIDYYDILKGNFIKTPETLEKLYYLNGEKILLFTTFYKKKFPKLDFPLFYQKISKNNFDFCTKEFTRRQLFIIFPKENVVISDHTDHIDDRFKFLFDCNKNIPFPNSLPEFKCMDIKFTTIDQKGIYNTYYIFNVTDINSIEDFYVKFIFQNKELPYNISKFTIILDRKTIYVNLSKDVQEQKNINILSIMVEEADFNIVKMTYLQYYSIDWTREYQTNKNFLSFKDVEEHYGIRDVIDISNIDISFDDWLSSYLIKKQIRKENKLRIVNIDINIQYGNNKTKTISCNKDNLLSILELEKLIKKPEENIEDTNIDKDRQIPIIDNFKRASTTVKVSNYIRETLWTLNFGHDTNGYCYVCNKDITRDNWHCSHVISKSNGGSNEISNLKICCPPCNLSMGSQNLYEYKKMKLAKK